MMQLNLGLPVWQKPKAFFHQILSVLWKRHNKRLRGKTINKTLTNQNQTEPKRTKTVIWNRAMPTLASWVYWKKIGVCIINLKSYSLFVEHRLKKSEGVWISKRITQTQGPSASLLSTSMQFTLSGKGETQFVCLLSSLKTCVPQ